jgi:hypothetical protein
MAHDRQNRVEMMALSLPAHMLSQISASDMAA